MDTKYPFSINPDNWQTAYTTDYGYYKAGSVSRLAALGRMAAILVVLAYSALFLFYKLSAPRFLFDLGNESIPSAMLLEALDLGRLIAPIAETFKNNGRELTTEAVVAVEQPGTAWRINDKENQYLIQNKDQKIKVYEKQNGLFVLMMIIGILAAAYIGYKQIIRLASFSAKSFFEKFYLPPEGVDINEIIKYRIQQKVKLPMPFSELFPSISQFKYILVKDGEILKGDEWPAWMARNIGGPILLIVFDGSALYLERGNRFSRVVGPGVSFLERYEKIKYAVDLRAKVKEIKEDKDAIFVWTKDGIVVQLRVSIEYRIGDPQQTHPRLIYPFNSEAVKKAVERYSLRWSDPAKEPEEFTWEDAVWGQVTGVIPGYIGRWNLDDLLIAKDEDDDDKRGQILSPKIAAEILKKLNTNTNGFGVYVTNFQVLSIVLPENLENHYMMYWEAKKQSRAESINGEAKAHKIRAHEKAKADAQHNLIIAIAKGLKKSQNKQANEEQFTEALMLSLSKVLDHGLNDPDMRNYMAKETLEMLEKIQRVFDNNNQANHDSGH